MILSHHYKKLPEAFYSKATISALKSPRPIRINRELLERLDSAFESKSGTDIQALLLCQSCENENTPLAMAYAGHQFGRFVSTLGDGRAALLGEIQSKDGQLHELHAKGIGPTAFSRRGDGLAWIGPVLREYILSESMHALGIPTTRAVAALETGCEVIRERSYPGALMVRLAQSHIRVGTFEYFYYRKEFDHLRVLADFAIDRCDPDLPNASDERYLMLFDRVASRTLRLVSLWKSIGFIHGVMNTDNTSICGITIDYGPCAFLDAYKASACFSSIDLYGRYAFDQQAPIACWNLSAFAQTLVPLISSDEKKAIQLLGERLEALPDRYKELEIEQFAKKLGIVEPLESDQKLIEDFLGELERKKLDFTNSFRSLGNDNLFGPLNDLSKDWLSRWKKRVGEQGLGLDEVRERINAINPIIIPRNHLVENCIQSALKGDYNAFHELLEACQMPYSSPEENTNYLTSPAGPEERVHQTFCGT